MAKWGDGYRWGGGTLWGGDGVVSGAWTGEVVWIVNIDWTGTGAINESDHTKNVDIKRGREHYVKSGGSGFEPMRPGKATLTLDNSDARFDPYNTSSPIYGYILPGRKIQISVYVVATNTTYVRFTGHVTDIQPSSGENEVIITAEDGIRWLTDAEYSSGVTYSKTISEAIDLVLSFVNWPYQRNIQPSLQPLQVFEPGEGSAINVIQQLAEANLGVFFVDRYGKATFYPVSYDVSTSHSLDQEILGKDIRVKQPWEVVRNKIRVVANRSGKRPVSAVWNMAGVQYFDASETKTFGANFKSSDGITVETIRANTLRDATGTDVSGNFTVGKTAVTSTGCTLTVTNNYSAGAWLLNLRLVGSEIVASPENMTSQDASSILTYGPRTFVLNNNWMQDRAFAAAYAVMLKDHLKNPHKDPVIQIRQRPGTQYAIDLYDKIVFTSAKLGISATFTVGGMEEKWTSDTGQDVTTTLYLQTVLYDATVITPDPYDPGSLPEIPFDDIPFDWEPYIPPILPPITMPCMYPDATMNGPHTVVPSVMTLTTNPAVTESIINYPCTLRPGTAYYKSALWLVSQFFQVQDGQWIFYTPNDILSVTAFNSNNVTVATAVITGGGTAQTPRIATFSPTTALEVAGFKIRLVNSLAAGLENAIVTVSSIVPAGGGVAYDINFSTFIADTIYADNTPWIPSTTDITTAANGGNPANTYISNGELIMTSVPTNGGKMNWRWIPSNHLQGASDDSYIEANITKNEGFTSLGISFVVAGWHYDSLWGEGTGLKKYYVPAEHVGYDIGFFGAETNLVNANNSYKIASMLLHGFTGNFSAKKIVITSANLWNVCAAGLI